MDAVGEPDDGGQIGDEALGFGLGGLARIGEALHGGLDLAEAADVGFAADGRVDQLAAFPGFAILEDFDARGGGGGKRFHVLHQAGVAGDLVAGFVAQDLADGRDFGVVGSAGPVFERLLGGG